MKKYIVKDKNYSSGFLHDATERLEKYLNRKGFQSQGFLGFNKALRYREGILENREKVAVFGKGIWKDAVSLNLPKKYGRVLEIVSFNEDAVYLSDDEATFKE